MNHEIRIPELTNQDSMESRVGFFSFSSCVLVRALGFPPRYRFAQMVMLQTRQVLLQSIGRCPLACQHFSNFKPGNG